MFFVNNEINICSQGVIKKERYFTTRSFVYSEVLIIYHSFIFTAFIVVTIPVLIMFVN